MTAKELAIGAIGTGFCFVSRIAASAGNDQERHPYRASRATR